MSNLGNIFITASGLELINGDIWPVEISLILVHMSISIIKKTPLLKMAPLYLIVKFSYEAFSP